jgi:hypothetical protein
VQMTLLQPLQVAHGPYVVEVDMLVHGTTRPCEQRTTLSYGAAGGQNLHAGAELGRAHHSSREELHSPPHGRGTSAGMSGAPSTPRDRKP